MNPPWWPSGFGAFGRQKGSDRPSKLPLSTLYLSRLPPCLTACRGSQSRPPSLIRALAACYKWHVLLFCILKFGQGATVALSAVFVKQIVYSVSDATREDWVGHAWAAGMIPLLALAALTVPHGGWQAVRIGMWV